MANDPAKTMLCNDVTRQYLYSTPSPLDPLSQSVSVRELGPLTLDDATNGIGVAFDTDPGFKKGLGPDRLLVVRCVWDLGRMKPVGVFARVEAAVRLRRFCAAGESMAMRRALRVE